MQLPQAVPKAAPLGCPREVLQAIFSSCKAFNMQAPGVPPPKPLLVANVGGVPAFPVPISEWGREHYCKELGNRAPGAEEKADAADRVARMASALLGPERNQLSPAKKRVLSIGLIGRGLWPVRSAPALPACACLPGGGGTPSSLEGPLGLLMDVGMEPATRHPVIPDPP